MGGIGALLGGLGAKRQVVKSIDIILKINDFSNPTINFNAFYSKNRNGERKDSEYFKTKETQIDDFIASIEYLKNNQ